MGLNFPRAHNKMNNIWAMLYKLMDREVEPNIKDYNVVSTNDDVVTPLKEGLKETPQVMSFLNMAPYLLLSTKNKVWFKKPCRYTILCLCCSSEPSLR